MDLGVLGVLDLGVLGLGVSGLGVAVDFTAKGFLGFLGFSSLQGLCTLVFRDL